MSIVANLFYTAHKEGDFDAFTEGFQISGFTEHLINISRLWNKALIARDNLTNVTLTFTHLSSAHSDNYFAYNIMPDLLNCNSILLSKYIIAVRQVIKETKDSVSKLETAFSVKAAANVATEEKEKDDDDEEEDEEIIKILGGATL